MSGVSIKAYLTSLRWDGVPRVGAALARYFGASDEDSAQLSAPWFVSLVRRALEPGCAIGAALVFVGAQGIGKTLSIWTLTGEDYFGHIARLDGGRDNMAVTTASWIVELSELDSMGERARIFLLALSDHYRPPYARVIGDEPRRCIFVGTANEEQWLAASGVSNLFTPVRVQVPDVAAIKRDRDQLFAEAVELFRAMKVRT